MFKHDDSTINTLFVRICDITLLRNVKLTIVKLKSPRCLSICVKTEAKYILSSRLSVLKKNQARDESWDLRVKTSINYLKVKLKTSVQYFVLYFIRLFVCECIRQTKLSSFIKVYAYVWFIFNRILVHKTLTYEALNQVIIISI